MPPRKNTWNKPLTPTTESNYIPGSYDDQPPTSSSMSASKGRTDPDTSVLPPTPITPSASSTHSKMGSTTNASSTASTTPPAPPGTNRDAMSPFIMSYATKISDLKSLLQVMESTVLKMETQTKVLSQEIPAAKAADTVNTLRLQLAAQIDTQKEELNVLQSHLKEGIAIALRENILLQVRNKMQSSIGPLIAARVRQKVAQKLPTMFPDYEGFEYARSSNEVEMELFNAEARRKNGLITPRSKAQLHGLVTPSKSLVPGGFPKTLDELFSMKKEQAVDLMEIYTKPGPGKQPNASNKPGQYAQLPREAVLNILCRYIGITYQLNGILSAGRAKNAAGGPRRLSGPLVTHK